ncbi:hypothetical protein [Arthrobacter sp. 4R501]|uniref:hypothetical protein n=1 Tax=Arthrobacter sp. 4R501 TaxID=2058886 RepID=UPI002157B0A7|nr:hypothetical protein [Arthrobacter sp. 4R501]
MTGSAGGGADVSVCVGSGCVGSGWVGSGTGGTVTGGGLPGWAAITTAITTAVTTASTTATATTRRRPLPDVGNVTAAGPLFETGGRGARVESELLLRAQSLCCSVTGAAVTSVMGRISS